MTAKGRLCETVMVGTWQILTKTQNTVQVKRVLMYVSYQLC